MLGTTRQKVFAGLVAGLAVAGGGGAVAATQLHDYSAESKAVVADAAKRLGVTPSQLSSALKAAIEKQIDAAVADGRITKEQAAELKQRVESGDFPLVGIGGPADVRPPRRVRTRAGPRRGTRTSASPRRSSARSWSPARPWPISRRRMASRWTGSSTRWSRRRGTSSTGPSRTASSRGHRRRRFSPTSAPASRPWSTGRRRSSSATIAASGPTKARRLEGRRSDVRPRA